MPANYDELFGGGAMAAHYALQDRDVEMQKQQQAIRQQELANMFAEQNNPLQLENQRMANEQLGYNTQKDRYAFKQEQALAPFKMDAEKKKFILEAKQSDLDGMYIEAQRMAYSPDKATSDEGVRMMQLHKDFIKLREQGRQKEELLDTRTEAQKTLESVKQTNRVALKQTVPAKAVGSGSKGGGAITESKVLAPLLQEALTLQQAGDTEGANRALGIYQAAKQAQGFGRSDPNAGKPTLSPDGSLGTIPPKAPVQFPGTTPAPAQKAQHTLAQVMQMYPGRSAEEVKAAYKKKTGVDLK